MRGTRTAPAVYSIRPTRPALLVALLGVVVMVFGFLAPASATPPDSGGEHKVTICHRTNSVTNPYTVNVVDVASVNGVDDEQGQGDHYANHIGGVFDPAKEYTPPMNGDEWGDIIPPVPGVHNGLNWSAAGQAIYENGCQPVTPPTSTTTATSTTTEPSTTTTTEPSTTTTTEPSTTTTTEPSTTTATEPSTTTATEPSTTTATEPSTTTTTEPSTTTTEPSTSTTEPSTSTETPGTGATVPSTTTSIPAVPEETPEDVATVAPTTPKGEKPAEEPEAGATEENAVPRAQTDGADLVGPGNGWTALQSTLVGGGLLLLVAGGLLSVRREQVEE